MGKLVLYPQYLLMILTYRDLLPQEFQVLLAVLHTPLRIAQSARQQCLSLGHGICQHCVRTKPYVHLVRRRHFSLGEECVVQLECRLQRLRVVLDPESAVHLPVRDLH